MQETMQNVPSGGFQSGMMGSVTSISSSLQFGIDIVSIIIGVVAFFMAVRLVRGLGGRISRAIKYFIVGIVCNAAAIAWSLFLDHGYVLGGMYLDIHQNLMTLGMIFFIISTFRFSKLAQGA